MNSVRDKQMEWSYGVMALSGGHPPEILCLLNPTVLINIEI